MSGRDKLEILIEFAEDLRGLKEARQQTNALTREVDTLGSTARIAFGTFVGNIGARAATALTNQVTRLIGAGVRYRANLEQQTVAFSTLLGSMDAAADRMAELERFAATTPFRKEEIIEASRLLEIFTGGALSSGDALRMIGDAAASTGQRLPELANWVGRIYAMLEGGEPIGQATRRLMEMGVITPQVAEELRNVSTSAQGMRVLEREFGRFAGGMERQSQTLTGRLSTLQDILDQLSGAFLAGIVDEGAGGLERLVDILSDESAMENAREWGEIIHDLASGLKPFAAAAAAAGRGWGFLAAAMQDVVDGDLNWVEDDTRVGRILDRRIQRAGRREEPVDGGDIGEITGTGRPAPSEAEGAKRVATAERIQELNRQMARTQGQRARVESDALRTQADKRDELANILEHEAALVLEMRDEYQRLGNAAAEAADAAVNLRTQEGDAEAAKLMEEAVRMWERATAASTEYFQIQNEIAASGFWAEMQAELVDYVDAVGTAGEQIARAFTDIADRGVSSLSDGITDLIIGTGNLTDAMRSFGQIAIRTLVELGVQMLLNAALQSMIRKQQTAEDVSATTTRTAPKVAEAVATGISTFGAALIFGALALGMVAMAGGFRRGGFTGPGAPDEVAGVVHRGEYVIPQEAVRAIGLPALEEMHRTGRIPEAPEGGGAGRAASASPRPASGGGASDLLRGERTQIIERGRRNRSYRDDTSLKYRVLEIMRNREDS
ncbi:MAG: hypothetical protein JJU00_01250 [Opitutales bacterium]|nr:hypothetical protein [Opitutales bacterium]